jgi:hypothetical protein
VSLVLPLYLTFSQGEKGRAAKRCHQRPYLIIFCSRRVSNSERFYLRFLSFFLQLAGVLLLKCFLVCESIIVVSGKRQVFYFSGGTWYSESNDSLIYLTVPEIIFQISSSWSQLQVLISERKRNISFQSHFSTDTSSHSLLKPCKFHLK